MEYATEKFFSALYRHCDIGIIEIRCLKYNGNNFSFHSRQFLPLRDFIKHKPKDSVDVFFSVCPRADEIGTKQGVLNIPCLWIDLDNPSEGDKNRIRNFPIQPTAIVKTGGGFHIYWRLKEPLEKEDHDLAEKYLRALSIYFNADNSASEIARVLRFPYTYNYKYNPAKLVKIIKLRDQQEVYLEEFDNYIDINISSKINNTNNNIYIIGDDRRPLPDDNFSSETSTGDKIRLATDRRLVTTADVKIALHHRNESLYHLAYYLLKSGMSKQEVSGYLSVLALHGCDPPFTMNETEQVVKSAIKRASDFRKAWKEDVLEYLAKQVGVFTTASVHASLGASTRKEKKAINKCLERLAEDGVIAKTGKRVGEYRVLHNSVRQVDWRNEKTKDVELWLPLNLHEVIRVMAGSILAFSAVTNAGKTAFGINMAVRNSEHMPVTYLSTELCASEFAERIKKKWGKDDYEITFLEDVPSGDLEFYMDENGLNIIDYIEPPDGDYANIATIISAINKKLRDGVAIIFLQKKKDGSPMGGEYVKNKPHLFVTMDEVGRDNKYRAKILKAKRITDGYVNPKELECIYSIEEDNGVGIVVSKTFPFRLRKKRGV